jgi:predicted RNase H-like HicB family nuclease
MEQKAFIAVILKHAADSFEARFPDLPFCVAFAPTEEDVIVAAAEALADQLAEFIESEDSIPSPSPFAEIFADPQWRGGVVARIEATTRGAQRPIDLLACENGAARDNWRRNA